MIKIISGWSNPGGSTTAFINLTNAFNAYGYDTSFYGPHEYHLPKCKSGLLKDFVPTPKDIVIVHFLDVPKLNVKKQIFSCHETDVFPLTARDMSVYSKIHYVSRWQQEWHKNKKSYFILPNILEDLKPNKKPKEKIGGVIGSVDKNKQTHVCIQKALEDGCSVVKLFGNVNDLEYYNAWVKCYIEDKVNYGNIELVGHVEDKQSMYDSITDVYQYSIRETWSYVKGECQLTNTKYHSNEATNYFWKLDNKEIVERWIKELGV